MESGDTADWKSALPPGKTEALHPCVPMHREIKPKTLQSILKQAAISVDELLENL